VKSVRIIIWSPYVNESPRKARQCVLAELFFDGRSNPSGPGFRQTSLVLPKTFPRYVFLARTKRSEWKRR
jgi:hypothetical protein